MPRSSRPQVRARVCRWIATALAAGTVWTAVPAQVRADEFVDRANAAIRKVGDDKRSDKILLPLLPDLTPPPAVVRTQMQAATFGSKGPGWEACAAWAQGEPQKKVLAALPVATKDDNDPQLGLAFALPYGVDATDESLVMKEMYVDLGDQGTLAAARFLYLDELEYVGILVHVEASRLQAAGDSAGALKLLRHWMFFGRQMADRPFLKEKQFGMESMGIALERVLDIAYEDFRAEKHTLTPSGLISAVNLLRDRSLMLERIRLPEGDFIAREQLISRVIIPKGGPNPATFAPTMAKIAAVDRPLRLFSSAAFWEQARAQHVGWYPAREALDGMKADWERRWGLPPFDEVHQRMTYFRLRLMGRPRYAVVTLGMAPIEELFMQRRRIDLIQSGARMALACYAYFLREKTLPISLAAIRGPTFARTVDTDPYSSSRQDLQYFRAVTDTPKDEHGNEKLFKLRLWLPDPMPRFEVPLDKTQFVLYSVGPDDRSQKAINCTQGRTGEGDYLLWPPPLSLLRQHLLETGGLRTDNADIVVPK